MGSMASGTVTLAKYQFIMNSCFDPDYTAAGHQPYGFDQWAALYNHYVVEKCSAVMVARPAASSPILYGMYVSDDVVIETGAFTLIEQGAVFDITGPYKSQEDLRLEVDISKFFNRPDPATDKDLRADVASSPADVCVLNVFCQDPAQTDSQTLDFTLELRMTVRFMEPKDLGPSLLKDTKKPKLTSRTTSDSVRAEVGQPGGDPDGPFQYIRIPKRFAEVGDTVTEER